MQLDGSRTRGPSSVAPDLRPGSLAGPFFVCATLCPRFRSPLAPQLDLRNKTMSDSDENSAEDTAASVSSSDTDTSCGWYQEDWTHMPGFDSHRGMSPPPEEFHWRPVQPSPPQTVVRNSAPARSARKRKRPVPKRQATLEETMPVSDGWVDTIARLTAMENADIPANVRIDDMIAVAAPYVVHPETHVVLWRLLVRQLKKNTTPEAKTLFKTIMDGYAAAAGRSWSHARRLLTAAIRGTLRVVGKPKKARPPP